MLLQLDTVTVRLAGPASPPALSSVSLDLHQGEFVVALGSNGSGKSTLARVLAGIIEPDTGRVVGGQGSAAARVGLVAQDPQSQLLTVTVADEIAFGPEGAPQLTRADVAARVEREIERAGLERHIARDPHSMSGGEQQRVVAAAVRACDVDVLVFDEATSMLDGAERTRLLDCARELTASHAVVWVTQLADEVTWADRIVVLDAGQLVWDGPIRTWIDHPELAATWELDLPAPARVAHELRRRGVWPERAAIPRTMDELRATVQDTA